MATIDDYTELVKIGRGGCGVVYKARNKHTGMIAALKEIKAQSKEEGFLILAMHEVSLLKELQHPNIVSLEGVIYQDSKLYLVLECMQMDLRNYLDTLPPEHMIDHKLLKSYTYQILQGTVFCHSRSIIHRDLKPQNLLINGEGAIKLADFGNGTAIGVPALDFSCQVATLWYRAPEVLLGYRRYSYPVDVWSVGCIFAEMAGKIPLFVGQSERSLLYKMFRILGTPDPTQWPEISELPGYNPNFPKRVPLNLIAKLPILGVDGGDLLKQMLVYNPGKRISASDALLHPYFHDLDKSTLPSVCH